MTSAVADIARRLADNAEAVCRRYLSNGRREGRYWMVGDVHNAPGRSLYVRLTNGDGRRSAGKWTDAATGEHGDLLDIIAASGRHARFVETLAEARRFLSMPQMEVAKPGRPPCRASPGSVQAAGRLWAASKPIGGTPVRAYLAARALQRGGNLPALRYHPRCYYRRSDEDPETIRPAWPAMIAAVTDLAGSLKGVHRTWLDTETLSKAPLACPRRAMGHLLGHGVRFGLADEVMAFGEGIETMLSLHEIAPGLPLVAGLSAAHLAALEFPPSLRRLYVARDRDAAGHAAVATLAERSASHGIDIRPLDSRFDDLNADLVQMGSDCLAARVRYQMSPGDAVRFAEL